MIDMTSGKSFFLLVGFASKVQVPFSVTVYEWTREQVRTETAEKIIDAVCAAGEAVQAISMLIRDYSRRFI